ncbi:MAG: RelA/SpoT family protein [Candidatus Gracilibacteria bacterium]|nr:RelA/SpoT family protein [Candidatus Gracilibacteria bacterium]MDD2908705.1 RelA/SpoT family protein [Candidatus Gracilibacteria bacterium]
MEENLEVDYSKIDLLIEEIIKDVHSYMGNVSEKLIRDTILKAYIFTKNAHHGQIRKSGDPYLIHPVEATKELLVLKPDLVTIQACLLHDVPEDTPMTVEDIAIIFGNEVAHITSGMEKLSKLKYRGEERSIGSLRKMFIAISEDVRVVFVKLADRIHNMRTLEFHPDKSKRERIALETINIYAPIADRLGIFEFKEILETLCFKNLYPEEFIHIKEELDQLTEEQNIFVDKIRDVIYETIPAHIPLIDVSYRIKSPFSIYKKMQRKGYENVKDLHDLFAIRIITDNIPHCYEVLGEIHNKWSPIPNRFKDYIALPKENGYQSLHTTVLGVLKELGSSRAYPTEIQIRTREMHIQSEIGVAAHFAYSETGQSVVAKDFYWVSQIKKIVDQSKEQGDTEFMSSMKIGLFDDRIFVFSPKGDVINLSKGSTPVDFAYSIHSDLGNHLSIAKVNDKIVTLDHELSNGDRVEIIIDKNRKPLITWLSFVKTTRAKDTIKSTINKSNREELIEKGKLILNSYLQNNYGIALDKEVSILKNIEGRILDTKDKEDILVQIGNLSRKPVNIIRGVIEKGNFALKRVIENKNNPKKIIKNKESVSPEVIMIGGEKNIPYKIAHCCSPVPGDKIVGYLLRSGVTIHKINCPSLKKGNVERFISACYGDTENQKNGVTIKVEITFENQLGVLKKLTEILYKMNLSIEEIKSEKSGDLVKDYMTLETGIDDYYIFERLVERLRLSIKEFKEAKLIEIK